MIKPLTTLTADAEQRSLLVSALALGADDVATTAAMFGMTKDALREFTEAHADDIRARARELVASGAAGRLLARNWLPGLLAVVREIAEDINVPAPSRLKAADILARAAGLTDDDRGGNVHIVVHGAEAFAAIHEGRRWVNPKFAGAPEGDASPQAFTPVTIEISD